MICSDFTVVILTYRRPAEVAKTVSATRFVATNGGHLIVVDNGCEPALDSLLKAICPQVLILRPTENIGVGARNLGLEKVTTPYAITLDDDVRGLTIEHVRALKVMLDDEPDVGAVCFKVVAENPPHDIVNWCHHRRVEEFAEQTFFTNEISEGAVAFRMEAVRQTRMYPIEYFISHEGPALAVQLMNRGYMVRYSPIVTVTHSVAQAGRPSWRRYYFDTRNVIWLAAGYLPITIGVLTVIRGVGGIFIYSIRDGFLRFWLKGVIDGLLGLPAQISKRQAPTKKTKAHLREMEGYRPHIGYLIKRRLLRRGMQI